MTGLEVITVGRISVDLYASEIGRGWDSAVHFERSLGGSPTNVAVAAARLGRRSAVLTKVGGDPLGDYLRTKLRSFGVDTSYVGTSPDLHTPLALAVLDPPEDPPLLFYREPVAPDLTLEPADLDPEVVRRVPVFWLSGSALSREPARGACHAFLEARDRRRHTVLDLDYRPTVWSSEAEARHQIGGAVAAATVAVGNRAECEIAVGTDDPDRAADRLLERGVELAIVKLGGGGVLVAGPGGRQRVAPVPVQVLCGLGAGDAFGGALVHGLLEGWDPVRMVHFANAAGALVASRLLCSDAMPTRDEVLALLEESA